MKDVVCGMDVDESSKFKSSYKGKTYHFCSAACKQNFDKKPETYTKG
jgi:YHS domain-containing protein